MTVSLFGRFIFIMKHVMKQDKTIFFQITVFMLKLMFRILRRSKEATAQSAL